MARVSDRDGLAWYRASFGIAWAASAWFGLAPGDGEPGLPGVDKVEHLLGFAVLAVLLRWAWPALRVLPGASLLFGWGVCIELLQSQIPGRMASAADAAADGAGIALGLLLVHGLKRLRSSLTR